MLEIRGELPMNEKDQLIEQRLYELDGRIRHCFRSAYNHLRKSWKLYGFDDDMSAFRAITAEEEAASAVILAIKQRQYAGAKQLKERDHTHKAVVFQIVQAVNNLLAEIPDFPKVTLRIAKEGKPKVQLIVQIPTFDGSEDIHYAQPDNPLNFGVKIESPEGNDIPFPQEQLTRTLSEGKFKDFDAYIRAMANRRNRLLYASDEGYPAVEFEETFILDKLDRVRKLGLLTISILQDREKHILVKQCLEIVLTKLSQLTSTGYDFVPENANDP